VKAVAGMSQSWRLSRGRIIVHQDFSGIEELVSTIFWWWTVVWCSQMPAQAPGASELSKLLETIARDLESRGESSLLAEDFMLGTESATTTATDLKRDFATRLDRDSLRVEVAQASGGRIGAGKESIAALRSWLEAIPGRSRHQVHVRRWRRLPEGFEITAEWQRFTSASPRTMAVLRAAFVVRGGRLAGIEPIEVWRVRYEGAGFKDVTAEWLKGCPSELLAGLDDLMAAVDRRTGIDRSGPGCLCTVDLDRDGRLDLFIGRPAGLANVVLRNQGHGFEDISRSSGLDVLDAACAAAFGDLDGDGGEDLLVAGESLTWFRRNPQSLGFVAMADRGLREAASRRIVPRQSGARESARLFTSVSLGDVDRDGDLDCAVGVHQARPGDVWNHRPHPFADAANGAGVSLLRNLGAGAKEEQRFVDATEESGLASRSDGLIAQCALIDVDRDGALDLWIAEEYGGARVLSGDGAGRFETMKARQPAGPYDLRGRNRWLAPIDIAGDASVDVIVGRASSRVPAFDLWTEPDFLHISRRTRDVVESRSCPPEDWLLFGETCAGLAADLSGDGSAELFSCAGLRSADSEAKTDRESDYWRCVRDALDELHSEAQVAAAFAPLLGVIRDRENLAAFHPERLFVEVGKGAWLDVAPLLGVEDLGDGRCVISPDLDGDGDLDLVTLSRDFPALRILRNDWNTPFQGRDEVASVAAPAMPRPVSLVAPVPSPRCIVKRPDGGEIALGGTLKRPVLIVRGKVKAALAPPDDRDLVLIGDDDPARTILDLLTEHLFALRPEHLLLRVDVDGRIDAAATSSEAFESLEGLLAAVASGRWVEAPRPGWSRMMAAFRQAGLPNQSLRLAERLSEVEADAEIAFEWGLALRDLDRLPAAIDRWSAIKEDDENFAAALLEGGSAARALRRAGQAKASLERALEELPVDPRAHFELGMLRLELAPDNPDRGTENLRTAVYLDPRWFKARLEFGRALARVGRFEESARQLSCARSIEPDSIEVEVELAVLLRRRGELSAAEGALRSLVSRSPDDARIHFEHARVLEDLGRLKEAKEAAGRAAELEPENPGIQQLVERLSR